MKTTNMRASAPAVISRFPNQNLSGSLFLDWDVFRNRRLIARHDFSPPPSPILGLINFRPREQKFPVKLGYARPFIGDKRSRRRSSPHAGERVIGNILPPCALAQGRQGGMKWGGNVGKPRDSTRRGGPRKRGSFVPHLRAELDFHPGPRLKLSVPPGVDATAPSECRNSLQRRSSWMQTFQSQGNVRST